MSEDGIKNAKITGTELGGTERGPSFWVYVDYGGAGQGFGGYALGGAFTHYVITGILSALDVESWEQLKGKPVRVNVEGGTIKSIGHFLEDKWFTPSEYKK